METHDEKDLLAKISALRTGIKDITHDIRNPLGVLRMAAYYLQVGSPDPGKRAEYLKMIGDTVEKVEANLERLRALGDDPSTPISAPPEDTQQ
jgi:nitrogen-specific signal transduction histidine kinase